MQRREALFLAEMIDAGEQAIVLCRECGVEELQGDRRLRDALLWNFTVLGEAASKLPSQFKSAHPELNWARPTQLRNRIVHGYWSIDLEILHATATEHLPAFVAQLRAVLAAGD